MSFGIRRECDVRIDSLSGANGIVSSRIYPIHVRTIRSVLNQTMFSFFLLWVNVLQLGFIWLAFN